MRKFNRSGALAVLALGAVVAVVPQALAHAGLGLRRIESEDIPDTTRVTVTAQAVAPRRNDAALEQIVGRLSLEASVSAATWQIDRSLPES